MKALHGKQVGRRERGAQLLELALVLPFLLVLLAGVVDFAQAWNVRQILSNAARDGARVSSGKPLLDLTEPTPPSVVAVCEQVANYLAAEHVDLAFMNMTASTISTGCSSPTSVASSSGLGAPVAWTYYSTGTYGLKIERSVDLPTGCEATSNCIQSSRITLTYRYNWAFGFSHVVNLISSSNYPTTVPIEVYSTMPDLST